MQTLGVKVQTIYRTPLLYVVGLLLLSAALAYFGYREASRGKDKGKLGGAAIIAWILALSAVGLKLPSYFMDEIQFSESHMQWNVGPWWDRDEGSISLQDVKVVRVSVASGSGRPRWQRTVWELEMKDGTVESYSLFDLWMEHYLSVKEHFVSKGIAIEDRK